MAEPVAIFAASRIVTLAVAYIASLLPPGAHWTALLSKWDGGWYLSIATTGYAKHVPLGHGAAAQNNTGFFPAYPMLIKTASKVTGWSHRTTGLLIALTAGAAAAAVLWALVARLVDPATATRSVALFSFFPSAFIFSMVYAESLLILFAALCLFGLVSERWLLAGVAAAAASAVRPNGSVLVLCCLWAAVVVVRRDRSWRPLIAPLLAPVGVVGFFVFLRVHTGDAFAFIRSNHRGWNQGFDFGANTAHKLWKVAQHPQADFNQLVSALSIGFVAVALVLLWSWRPPFAVVIYAVGILGLALLSTELTSTSRYVLTSFPLIVAVARRVRGPAFHCLLGVSASLMAALMILSSTTLGLTP